MCGLYSFRTSREEARALFNYLEEADFPPRQHVTPLSPMAIIRQEQGGRHFAWVSWGLVPSWLKEPRPGKPLINARCETVLEKPSFKNAIRRRRCLIPADGYYEWLGDVPGRKISHHVHRPDHGPFAFAGLWEHWMGADGSEIETAAIITTEANAALAVLNDRMPAMVHPQDYAQWLDVTHVDGKDAVHLLKPADEDYFVFEPTTIDRKTPPPRPKAQLSLF